jgi:putative membrane protein
LQTPTPEKIKQAEPAVLLIAALLATALSAVAPFDWLTWWMEAVPVLIAVPILLATYRRHPLTPLLYRLIFLHMLVLLFGAHYSYARVPLGFWMEDLFGFGRNHYDRIGHFMQGFMPAILSREILLRAGVVRRGGWLFFICVCICLAFSAFYELIEWWSAVAAGDATLEFLGTQGDVWDAQWDMLFALIGGVCSLLLLSRLHDRQLAKMKSWQ